MTWVPPMNMEPMTWVPGLEATDTGSVTKGIMYCHGANHRVPPPLSGGDLLVSEAGVLIGRGRPEPRVTSHVDGRSSWCLSPISPSPISLVSSAVRGHVPPTAYQKVQVGGPVGRALWPYAIDQRYVVDTGVYIRYHNTAQLYDREPRSNRGRDSGQRIDIRYRLYRGRNARQRVVITIPAKDGRGRIQISEGDMDINSLIVHKRVVRSHVWYHRPRFDLGSWATLDCCRDDGNYLPHRNLRSHRVVPPCNLGINQVLTPDMPCGIMMVCPGQMEALLTIRGTAMTSRVIEEIEELVLLLAGLGRMDKFEQLINRRKQMSKKALQEMLVETTNMYQRRIAMITAAMAVDIDKLEKDTPIVPFNSIHDLNAACHKSDKVRYFSHKDPTGKPVHYINGRTSLTAEGSARAVSRFCLLLEDAERLELFK